MMLKPASLRAQCNEVEKSQVVKSEKLTVNSDEFLITNDLKPASLRAQCNGVEKSQVVKSEK